MTGSVKQREPLLKRGDFAAHLEAKARETAPRDVEILLGQAEEARQRARGVSSRMGRQMDLALDLLADHAAGECPQIPFHTVSLLAEAVFYVLDPNDVIPDWIPGIGNLDDAVVLELAFELGASGVGRYCSFKEIDWSDLKAGGGRRGRRAAADAVEPQADKLRTRHARQRKAASKAPTRALKAPPRRRSAGSSTAAKKRRR